MTRSYASFGRAAALSGVPLLSGCGTSGEGSAGTPATSAPAVSASADAGSASAQSANPTGGYWSATVQRPHNDKLGKIVLQGLDDNKISAVKCTDRAGGRC